MSKFEYFAVFESLLYGLALAHILISFSEMITHRKTIKLYWPHLALVSSGVLTLAQRYFAGFHGWKYGQVQSTWEFFCFIMLPMSLFFMVAYIIFPKNIEGTNFGEFFWKKHKEIITVFVAFAISAALRNAYSDIGELNDLGAYLTSRRFIVFFCSITFMGLLGLLGIASRKKWVVKLLAIVTLAYNSYIFLIT